MNHKCFQIIFYLIFYLTRLIKRLLDTFWLSSSIRHNSFILTFLSSVLTLAYLRPHDPSIFCCLVTCLRACVCVQHGLQTPNEAFFHPNSKLLGLGRQFGQINFGTFRVISADWTALILVLSVPCPMFSINQPLFLQNTKLLYPHSKYLFGIGIWIWIWATKN